MDKLTTLQAEQPVISRRSDSLRSALIIAALLLGVYWLLHNPYWVRGGDSEVYLCLGRSLASGKGYRFSGQPVALVPPGWPMVLAAAMKVSASFAWLKLLPMLAMTSGLVMMFLAMRRLTTTPRATLATLLAALLPPVFQLTYWFHAESLFCLITGSSLLLAVQISQGRRQHWRLVALVLLCGLSVTVRWAGVLFWPVLAGALLHGQFRPRLDRRWIAAGLSGAVALAVFVALRLIMHVSPDQIDPRYDASLSISYELVNEPTDMQEYASRLAAGGGWFAKLLWSAVMLLPWKNVRTVAESFGWLILLLFMTAVIRGMFTRQWLWLGVAVYFAALWINWPQPIGRYLVPLAPLLILGALQGAAVIAGWFGAALSQPVFVGMAATLVGLIFFPNFVFYLIDVWVMRSPNFAARFEGGIDQELLAAADFLRQRGVDDGQVATSRSFATHSSQRFTSMWNRSAIFLLNRSVIPVPAPLSTPPDPQTIQWLEDQGVRYYLYLPPVPLFWHYRMLSHNGVPIFRSEACWQLYEIADGLAWPIPLEPAQQGLRRVPGL